MLLRERMLADAGGGPGGGEYPGEDSMDLSIAETTEVHD
jgi:hypothetical protein